MASPDLALTVAKIVEEMRKAGGFPKSEHLLRLATEIASVFRSAKNEIAILTLSTDGKMLRFLYPARLQRIGAIPISSVHSLATKTIRDRRGEVINNFAAYKHPTVFEAVDLSEREKAAPIQKIMSAPMIADGKVVGVIQVSRKGKPGESIGPDFTHQDISQLTSLGGIVAKYLATIPAEPPKAKS
jgi:GAF domain-containing protein